MKVPNNSCFKSKKYNIFSKSIKNIALIVFLTVFILKLISFLKKFIKDQIIFLNQRSFLIKQIRSLKISKDHNSGYLLLCHPVWMGIKIATFQINLPIIEIKDFSNKLTQIFLIKFIIDNSFKFIVINSILPGTFDFSSRISHLLFDVKILLTYHGSFTQHTSISEGKLENKAIKYLINGTIWRMGILKQSNAKWFSSLSVKNVYPLSNMKRSSFLKLGKYHFLDGLKHIGIFSAYNSRKNVINQIAAACLLGEGYLIHLIYLPDIDAPYISEYCKTPILVHSKATRINHLDLDLLLSSMNINLYISLSECHPMVALESISVATPCITSDVSNIYDFDDNLRKLMVVRKHDNIFDIYQAIKRVEKNIDYLTKIQPNLLDIINEYSLKEWNKFLNYSLIPLNKSIDNYDIYINVNNNNQSIKDFAEDIFINKYKYKNLKICYVINDLKQGKNSLDSLIAGIIKVLTDNNFKIVILVDISLKSLNKYLEYFEVYEINFNKVKLYNLESIKIKNLKKLKNFPLCYQRSVKFALALSEIQKKEFCDIIEFHGGFEIAYELLNSPSLYFPEKIPKIFIRITQTKTNLLLEKFSSLSVQNMTFTYNWDYEYSLVYLMELYSSLKSDILISSNESIIDFFSKFYLLDKSRFSIIPPPLNQIKYPFHKYKNLINYDDIKKSNNFLIYGELSPSKGINLILKASLIWMEKNNIEANFYFIGKNNYYNIMQFIPEKYKKNYIFIEKLNIKDIIELSKKMRCAIFADRFYSLGIEPYIIYNLGLPLIISSISSLKNHFSEMNSFIFEASNITSLVYALNETVYNETKLKNLVEKKYYTNYNFSICLAYLHLEENIKSSTDKHFNKLRQNKYLEINKIIKEILKKKETDILPFY